MLKDNALFWRCYSRMMPTNQFFGENEFRCWYRAGIIGVTAGDGWMTARPLDISEPVFDAIAPVNKPGVSA
jgi:hypothetical protein